MDISPRKINFCVRSTSAVQKSQVPNQDLQSRDKAEGTARKLTSEAARINLQQREAVSKGLGGEDPPSGWPIFCGLDLLRVVYSHLAQKPQEF